MRLGSIVYNRGQITPSTDFCYIDIGSIDNKKQKLNPTDTVIAPDKAPSRARKLVDKGDVLYSTVRPYLHNMCIVDRDFSCIPIASTGFAVLTCHAELCNKFLFYYMMSPDFDAYANNTDNAKGVAYYDWMRRSQLGMSMAYAFFPAQMLTILPFGWLFYTHGTLTVETFVTVIILALGMAAPIVAAFNFVDTLAQVGTTVSQVDEILKAEEQVHGTQRAMLKNAPVIILDEATAYIDPKNEAVIQSAVAKLVKNKTVIVIAHRLSTITGADNIVVVKDGQIAAQGRHEQLVAQPGIYADFVGGK